MIFENELKTAGFTLDNNKLREYALRSPYYQKEVWHDSRNLCYDTGPAIRNGSPGSEAPGSACSSPS